MDARDSERPNFSLTQASEIARNLFNILDSIKEIKELPSYLDRNFHITLESGQEYVLKISAVSEEYETLDMQNCAMRHLAANIEGHSSTVVHKSRNGVEIERVEDKESNQHYVRLLSFLPGKVLSQVNPHASDMFVDFGRFIGSISKAFISFDHSAAHREFRWDLKRASTVIRDYSKHTTDSNKQKLVSYFLELFETLVLPPIDYLRSSVIHNDANDNNIIVSNPHDENRRSFGILDFGDMIHSCTINELAIAIAYAILGKADPISVAQEITSGYHSVFPISELELELLFPLICARLVTSASISAYQKTLEPDNEYLVISEAPAWQVLSHLRNIPPRYFTYCLRSSVGLEPCPSSAEVKEWIANNSNKFASPIGKSLDESNSVIVDLSVGSTDIASPLQLADFKTFS
ncbi:MAG: phosphotransferase, partial [Candidatus Thorarchaeota archaeon]|nr:phosphotransferase [Candidatus Thorarchaeota archaeon]